MMKFNNPFLEQIGICAEEININCYVVGGWVRDLYLGAYYSNDIDIVCVNRSNPGLQRPGIALAKYLAKRFPECSVNIYKNYGTALLKLPDVELEFVGARKISYPRGEISDIIEDGSLLDDQLRRDFTINSIAIGLNPGNYGKVYDPFNGLGDIERKLIRVVNSRTTFLDDPLRILRAVRFATKYGFVLEEDTYKFIQDLSDSLYTVARERINEELNKIMTLPKPSIGWCILDNTNTLKIVFPELLKLKETEYVNGRGHKDIFAHSLQVLDNVAKVSDNLWLRWAALLHDIGKPECKVWIDSVGWTFRDHAIIGSKLIPDLFRKYKFPLNNKLDFVVKMVYLHMRPIHLVEEGVTDSAIRRILVDSGDDIESLMILCDADVTSKNAAKRERIHNNYQLLKSRISELIENDRIRNFQPLLDGQEIMRIFNLKPGPKVGELKQLLKDAILDGAVPNTIEASIEYLNNALYKTK